MNKRLRILIVDGGSIFLDGLRRLLEAEPGLEVVSDVTDVRIAGQFIEQTAPDVVLLDLAMPEESGLNAIRTLTKEVLLQSRLIILTASISRGTLLEVLLLGARGVILKDSATQILMECIQAVMLGQYWIFREAVQDIEHALSEFDRATKPPDRFSLTQRELQIVAEVSKGSSNKEIAGKLGISENTVQNHLTAIFDKVGVDSRNELLLFALKNSLVERS